MLLKQMCASNEGKKIISKSKRKKKEIKDFKE